MGPEARDLCPQVIFMGILVLKNDEPLHTLTSSMRTHRRPSTRWNWWLTVSLTLVCIAISKSSLPHPVGGFGISSRPATGAASQGMGVKEENRGKRRGARRSSEQLATRHPWEDMCRDEFTEEELLAMEESGSEEEEGDDDDAGHQGGDDGTIPKKANERADEVDAVDYGMFGDMLQFEVDSKREYMDLVADDFTQEELWAMEHDTDEDEDEDISRIGPAPRRKAVNAGVQGVAGPFSKGKRCHAYGCEKFASFGVPSGGKASCKEHASEGEILLTGRRCMALNCRKQPCYGPMGAREVRCSAHKLPGDVSLVKRYFFRAPQRTLPPSLIPEKAAGGCTRTPQPPPTLVSLWLSRH